MNNRTFASTWPALAKLLALVCCLLAVGAALRMEIRLFPDRPLPEYTVRFTASGMSAEMVDEKVARPAEEAIRSTGLALKISARAQAGSAMITVKTRNSLFGDDREKLESKLRELAASLPVSDWKLSQSNLADDRVGYYLVHGSDVQTISDAARYEVAEKIGAIPGVARVEVDNTSLRQEMELVFRPSMLQVYGLTPGDVIGQLQGKAAREQVGSVGTGTDQTHLQWSAEWTSPQELGKQLISTERGYIPLKTLVDIRDLRGSKGESVYVYRGEPAVGITVYGAAGSQLPSIRAEVMNTVSELNNAAKGRYQIDLADDFAAKLTAAVRDTGWLVMLLTLGTALAVGIILRSLMAGSLSLLSQLMATGALLGGMWLCGIPLTLTSIGPVALFAVLFAGAGVPLFHRIGQEGVPSQENCLNHARELMKPVLLAIVILAACLTGLMTTDIMKSADLPLLHDVLPVTLIGTVVMLGVYGFIVPILIAAWLPEGFGPARQGRGGKWTKYLVSRWERTVGQRFLPFGIALAVSLIAVVLFHSFVPVDPYSKTDGHKKTLSLAMIKGSTIDEAMQAAKAAEERLLALEEVRDVYTVASKENLIFHLQLEEKDEWTRTRIDLEKELEKSLREIPRTDPFAMVVSDDQKTRLEVTVKGPSLHTTKGIAMQVVSFLQEMRWLDKDGKEIITDERLGSGTTGTYIAIKPKQDVLTRYRVTEAEVRRQMESYLGKQTAGNMTWNSQSVPVTVRFPDNWMEHADQVKNILIRTPAGAVRLQELADWSLTDEPPVYQREDGDYVFLVSSAVSVQSWIEGISYSISHQMEEETPIPEGYRILSASELKKEQEEATNDTDATGRFLAGFAAIATILVASMLLLRRMRDGIIALALLPVLSGGVMFGLLLFDRPLNVMGFYGIAAAAAIMVQQAVIFLNRLAETKEDAETLLDGIRAQAARSVPGLISVFAALTVACLPFACGLGNGDDLHAPFAAALLIGTLLAIYAVIVLTPAIYLGSEYRRLYSQPLSVPAIRQHLHTWWENEKVRRLDSRGRKRKSPDGQPYSYEDSVQQPASERPRELSKEDFLPLSASPRDANQ
ncbi:efflux RND transporter permease subunit [Brevibacillus borstelensis]|uniref:efflux RND transporter permease subunit n=1 Tax=Brevibacillus borstelensis TaxID=45462 RepID=UPI0030CCA215